MSTADQSGLPEPSQRFEILEHTADVGVRAFGVNPEQTFQSSVAGLFSILLESGGTAPTTRREIRVTAGDYATLLCNFLNDLIYLFDAEKLVPVSVVVDELTPSNLRTRVEFTDFDPSRHKIRTYAKAVTYHQLRFELHESAVVAEFYLDV